MKMSAVKALCKKRKYVHIFNETGEDGSIKWQLLSTGDASFMMENMPIINEANILTLFDVNSKQSEKWHTAITEIPSTLSFADYTQDEYQLEESDVEIAVSGKLLKALHTRKGILFVDTELLKPISGDMDMLTFWERKSTLGETFIAAKVGMTLQAIICPFNDITPSLAVALDAISQGVLAYVGENQKSGEGKPV